MITFPLLYKTLFRLSLDLFCYVFIFCYVLTSSALQSLTAVYIFLLYVQACSSLFRVIPVCSFILQCNLYFTMESSLDFIFGSVWNPYLFSLEASLHPHYFEILPRIWVFLLTMWTYSCAHSIIWFLETFLNLSMIFLAFSLLTLPGICRCWTSEVIHPLSSYSYSLCLFVQLSSNFPGTLSSKLFVDFLFLAIFLKNYYFSSGIFQRVFGGKLVMQNTLHKGTTYI